MAGAAPPQEVPPHGASPVLHSCPGRSRTDWGCPCLPQVFWAQILAQQHAAPCKEPPGRIPALPGAQHLALPIRALGGSPPRHHSEGARCG